MSNLLKRPRLVVAIGLAMAFFLTLETAVLATSYSTTGGAVKEVKVVTSTTSAVTTSTSWLDLPDMQLTMSVPSDQQGLFLITFSATAAYNATQPCHGAGGDVRVLINRFGIAEPGPVEWRTSAPETETQSMQFVAGPFSTGQYGFTVQYSTYIAGCNFWLFRRTLSILRSRV